MRSVVLVVAALFLTVAACDSGKRRPAEGGAGAAPAPQGSPSAARAAGPAPAGQPASGRDGAPGPLVKLAIPSARAELTADLVFSEDALRPLFPGFTLRPIGGDNRGPTLIVLRGEEAVLRLAGRDGHLAAVIVVNQDVRGPRGLGVGSSFADLQAAGSSLSCARGTGPVAKLAVCRNADAANIDYILPLPKDTSVEAGQPLPSLAGLAGSKVLSLRWRPLKADGTLPPRKGPAAPPPPPTGAPASAPAGAPASAPAE